MKSNGILWDNDGVLVDTEGLFYEANRTLFAEHQVELSHSQFFDWFLCDNIGAWHLLAARGYSIQEIAQLREMRNRYYADLLNSRTNLLIDGMSDIVESLAQSHRMGIVTSSRRDHFELIHRRTNVLQHFDFVVTEEDYPNSKPAPDPYLLGLKKMGLGKDKTVVIEDSPRGLQAAISAGLRCIVIRNALTRHYPFEGAHCVVDDADQLIEALS